MAEVIFFPKTVIVFFYKNNNVTKDNLSENESLQ